MSTITSLSTKESKTDSNKVNKKSNLPNQRLESRLNIKDLESLQNAFLSNGDSYDNMLSLSREQFCEALALLLSKGTKEEYGELFDKIDVTKEGQVDWDKFASHMLLEFYEKDDRVKSTQVPQWKDIKHLASPHKEIIQRVIYLKNSARYLAISKEGCVSMWGPNLKLQRSLKTGTDACRARDLWITDFIPLPNINKIALAFTSKEIAFYDLSSKLEFNCQYKVQGLEYTPLCLDYWSHPNNTNEAIIVWGDVGGCVNALRFTSASIALFERPPAPAGEKQESCLNVQLADIARRKYKNCMHTKHRGHTDWVRQVKYSSHLECFISCATTWNNSLVIGWMEKHATASTMKTSTFQISQGTNAFDHHEGLNLIATAGVNHHVCLWNPYVDSKPNGVLRGHMAAVIQVQFNRSRGQLISFSKDKVLRIWDVQLQVCIQRLAGMFPKGPEVTSTLYFDEIRNRLFISFNYQLTMMEMKVEFKGHVVSHEKPVVAALYNSTYNQVVSVCQGGTVVVWMVDTGQKVKSFANTHGQSEVTALAQDLSETRLFTGSTDGTIKTWDFNGHCYHTLECGLGNPADVGQIVIMKRSVLALGWARHITVFRNNSFKEYHVQPAEWKGGQEHADDILCGAFCAPHTLATGSYDGEIILWNTNSEQASKHLTQRSKRHLLKSRGKSFITNQETFTEEGGPGSLKNLNGRPKTRGVSRGTDSTQDEQNEYGFAVTRLIFLEARKGQPSEAGANLVSCGGNGVVRFWNTNSSQLLAEFTAHPHVASILMASDKETNSVLVTGDADGYIKVWNIHDYCVDSSPELNTNPPVLRAQMAAHQDSINGLDICVRNDRTLILSASADCSAALWDIDGKQIGVFGQEPHWKIEPYTSSELEEESSNLEEEEAEENDADSDADSNWEPEDEAVEDPSNFRINTWNKTHLGKDYQELRVKKRERRQPGTITNLPYLHWEKTGAAPAGPYSALTTAQLVEVPPLQKPDFITNPDKYFVENLEGASSIEKLPRLAEMQDDKYNTALKAAFDEKNLFPKYILDYESKMRSMQISGVAAAVAVAGNAGGKTKTRPSPTLAPHDKQKSEQAAKRGLGARGRLKPIRSASLKDVQGSKVN